MFGVHPPPAGPPQDCAQPGAWGLSSCALLGARTRGTHTVNPSAVAWPERARAGSHLAAPGPAPPRLSRNQAALPPGPGPWSLPGGSRTRGHPPAAAPPALPSARPAARSGPAVPAEAPTLRSEMP